MNYLRCLILSFTLFWIFTSCDISSPYIDAITVKIDEDNEGNGGGELTGVVGITDFQATVVSYDSTGTNQGIVNLTWTNPEPVDSQTDADMIYIRAGEGLDPESTASGVEVYHGDPSSGTTSYPDMDLDTVYHFGAWTEDAHGNVSGPYYVNAAIGSATLNVVVDAYTDDYTYYDWGANTDYTPDYNSPSLVVGEESGFSGPCISFIQFDDLAVSGIIQADLHLTLTTIGSVDNFEVSRLSASWNSSSTYLQLVNLGYTLIDSFDNPESTGGLDWDLTSTVQYWENNSSSNYGIRIEDTLNGYNSIFYSNEGSGKPRIDLYYQSE